ncbi:MAG: VWA domain-containing protein [Chloroflexia bacterium]
MTPDLSLETALAMLALDPALGGLALLGGDGWELGEAAASLAAALGPQARVLRLPVGIAPDQMLGGLDLDATLRQGRRVVRPGLLAAHDGGVLWLPDPDLLPTEIVAPLTAALRHGAVQLERDGLSARHPTRLLLLTAAPSRYPSLLEQAGLWLPIAECGVRSAEYGDGRIQQSASSRQRAAVSEQPSVPLNPHYALRTTHYAAIADDQIAVLAAVAMRLGVTGLRADYLAARAARAVATLAGRAVVEDVDLDLAVAFVLAPRAGGQPSAVNRQPSAEILRYAQNDSGGAQNDSEGDSALRTPHSALVERLIGAQAALLPRDALPNPAGRRNGGWTGEVGAGRMAGERRLLPARHGRPGPARADRRRPRGATLDVSATLEAAAWRIADRGLRSADYASISAWDVGPRTPQSALRTPQSEDGGKFVLRAEDLRWRTPEAPAGVLFVLAVDASGSMARNRLGPAKGAALLLLERAYLRRDRVALIGIRGPEAGLLLPPTRSSARARRLLESLPAGGGTPLASALALGLEVAVRAGPGGYGHTLLVLLTDGRANVPLAAPPTPQGIAAEVVALAGRWATLSARGAAATLVIDTRLRYLSAGEAPALAQTLAARYLYLPHATPTAVGKAAEETAGRLGWR